MLGFLGANLTSVSRKTKLPRGAQSNTTTKQLLSEQRNFKCFPSKAERISNVPSYTRPSCCRKRSNLYIGTQGTKLRSRIKNAQFFTNFDFPAVWVYASWGLLGLFAGFVVATLLFPWQPIAETAYLFLRLCSRRLEKTGSLDINITSVLLCLSSGTICLK